ncbi:Zinc finger protein basonuclin-2 [Bagarius yarrelli]|uniref:Zinc finger protein basonuclin-2 n=1 Tax=Bagarius yarrelli TaxID=175774 RepID=A0A556VWR4_BAGYA|nr:Zinc finger protein basonuclin-2 [Bagarius yarrelli]
MQDVSSISAVVPQRPCASSLKASSDKDQTKSSDSSEDKAAVPLGSNPDSGFLAEIHLLLCHLYHPSQVEIVQSNVVFDISSLMLYGTHALPVRLKILLDRLFSVLKQDEDAAGKVLDRWTIMSREEEIITLQQFLRFGETKSIVELMAIQEKEGQAVTVPSSKADSGIRTFIESNNRTRSPGLLTHLENSSPSSIHHFENIPNSLAFLLPFQYINPVSAPMLGLPPNGLNLDQAALRLREPNLSNQSEPVESSESEVSLSPFRNSQSPNRGALVAIPNSIEPKTEPNGSSPITTSPSVQHVQQQKTQQQQHHIQPQQQPQSNAINDHHFVKNEQSKSLHSSFSSKMHRMRRMGTPSRKGRVCCNACGKTFYDKGTLKIHYNAVHLKIKHRCTIEGCNMVFSSLRSRNRHSANPNPRLHMPMLRNNRDKDLIRSTSGSATPVISSTKSGYTLTSPGRPPLGFATPPLDPMIHSPLQSPLVFPSLKSVQPVQPIPPFYRNLLSPADIVSPPVSLPTSPILPTTTNSTSIMDQHQQILAASSNSHMSETGTLSHHLSTTSTALDPITIDPTPKKKPRKSSMPVKIEKDREVPEDYDDKDDDNDDESCHHRQPASHLHNNINGNCNNNNNSSSGHQSPSQDEMTEGTSELRCMDSFTSEDQDHERDFENESETSESKMFYRDEPMDAEEKRHASRRHMDKETDNREDGHIHKEMEDKRCSSPSPHQPVIKIKEELNDPTYDMFCMGQYNLYNGGMAAAAAAAASMAALHESFISSMGYESSSPKFHSQSPEGDLCSSPDPKICYVCKKSFKSSYSVKLHYRNVHLKEMHVCTVAGCNAAFPSRRSRDRMRIGKGKLIPLPRDVRAELAAKIYSGHRHEDPVSPIGNGYRGDGDYAALDLSTASSIHSSGSVQSSRDSDEASDEGVLLDELDVSEGEEAGPGLGEGAGLATSDPASSPSAGANGGILCSICHKMYSNKGTLRVHYKTVHLREMHRCKVPGCNMMFSSVRSRNRHSQNPNLHKNTPFISMVD